MCPSLHAQPDLSPEFTRLLLARYRARVAYLASLRKAEDGERPPEDDPARLLEACHAADEAMSLFLRGQSAPSDSPGLPPHGPEAPLLEEPEAPDAPPRRDRP